jgi:hypothetical protein
MEQVIWISPIVVVLKNNNKLRICIIFESWTLPLKRTHTHYPSCPWCFKQGIRSWSMLIFGFFWVPSNSNCPWEMLQDNIHYKLGSVHLGGNAIWTKKCATYLPKNSE